MARDPLVAHSERVLREGLWHVASGGDLRVGDPVRVELLHLGLVRALPDDSVLLTPDGRGFLGGS
jgi:hypothetical protein